MRSKDVVGLKVIELSNFKRAKDHISLAQPCIVHMMHSVITNSLNLHIDVRSELLL